jgi:hypothetical protein
MASMFMFEMQATNLTKPVPWPWRHFAFWDVCLGVFFVCVPVFYAGAVGWLMFARRKASVRRPVVAAATFIGIPYLFYAFARADIEHLAMNIHAFLLAVMALPFELPRQWRRLAVGFMLGIAAVSLITLGAVSPLYRRLTAPPGRYQPMQVGRWTIWEPRNHAGLIEGAIRFNANVIRPDEGFLIAPQTPALYPILNRLSPVWQVTYVFPLAEWRQQQMIADLERKRVNWVLLQDVPTDGRDELRFRYTHRLVWEYITKNFEVVPEGLEADFSLFKRKIPIAVPSAAEVPATAK